MWVFHPRHQRSTCKIWLKVDKEIFIEYYDASKAYEVFNLITLVVEESINLIEAIGSWGWFCKYEIGLSVAPKEDEIK